MTTLSDMKRYMESRRRASLGDIVVGLHTTPDMARHLLEIWQAKERVRIIPCASGSCGKGVGCSCGATTLLADVYEWLGEDESKSDAS